jgi:hypothetical protein
MEEDTEFGSVKRLLLQHLEEEERKMAATPPKPQKRVPLVKQGGNVISKMTFKSKNTESAVRDFTLFFFFFCSIIHTNWLQ